MNAIQQLLTDSLDIWSAAETEKKSGRGRASGNAARVYGIRKLRELILELAVRGKLVPQDANDEPASALLKRIQAEKARLIAKGKIKKDKSHLPIAENEKPFGLPQGWDWVRLGDVFEMLNGRAFKPTDWIAKGLPIVRIQNLNNSEAVFNYCDEDCVDDRHIINNGSFLISWSGTPGTSFGAFIWHGGKAALNQHIFSCFQIGQLYFDEFLELAINTRLEELIAKAHGGAGLQHVTKGKLEALTLVLPSIAEQHRIVAKVDELMALCDQLETRHSNATEAHEKLVSHLLATLTQSQNAEDFRANWQRIAAHFDTLFTTEASIDVLKQTLLQLAVMGKLVPQDANDEPASALLKRIHAKKARLVAEGKIKKDKPLAKIAENEKLFDIPLNWDRTRLGELTVSGPNNGYSPKPSDVPTDYRCLTLSATTRGFFNADCSKYVDIDKHTAEKFFLKQGDLLIQRANSIDYVGISAIYDCKDDLFIYPDLMMRMRISTNVNSRYLHFGLLSENCRSYFKKNATGTQGNMPKINQGTVVNVLIPLPPLLEQHRIVAKVDELMTLCDRLKSRITDASRLQQKLADVLVQQAAA